MTNADANISRREAILAAAERAFNKHGYASTTVAEVAVEAGISKGSIYNYFQSKEDLFHQVFGHVVGSVEVDLGRIVAEPLSAGEKLSQALDYWYERLGRYLRIGRLVLESWATAARQDRQGELMAALTRVYDPARELLGSILAQGVESGEFRQDMSPSVGATLIMALLDGLQLESILGIGTDVDEQFLAVLKKSILASLRGGQDDREGSVA